MWERLLIESTLLPITGVFFLLIVIALWQKLYKAVLSMGVVYIVYIGSILISPVKPSIFISDLALIDSVPINTGDDFKKESAARLETSSPADTIPELTRIKIELKRITDNLFIGLDTLRPELKAKTEIITLPPENKRRDGTEIKVNSVLVGGNIKVRELIGQDSVFFNSIRNLYCLTGIYNLKAQSSISHNWYLNDILRASISVNIKWSHDWRCWTYITINPKLTGKWKVVIEGPQGAALDSVLFTIVPADTIQNF